MRAAGELGRIRRAQIVSLSMTEIMLLLVFMAVTFAFLSRQENQVELTAAQKQLEEARIEIRRLHSDLDAVRAELRKLQAERDDLDRLVRRLLPEAELAKATPAEILKWFDAHPDAAERAQRGVAAAMKGGVGLPRCDVKATHVLAMVLLGDGSMFGQKAWAAEDEALLNGVPGLSALSSGKSLDPRSASAASDELANWGRSQKTPCRFVVRVDDRQSPDKETYKAQIKLLEQRFYVSK